jgi:4-carboxymuconolactone decarboxylase
VLVRLAAIVAAGTDEEMRSALSNCVGRANPTEVEEVILQAYLFSGFPRTLNAMRAWRSVGGGPSSEAYNEAEWLPEAIRTRGEAVCERVYGDSYTNLRSNIRALHPALDHWMIESGYGRVLSRGGLDLATRELCAVAACAADMQERQLRSHMKGALNAGASAEDIERTLVFVRDLLSDEWYGRVHALWAKVRAREK